MVKRIGGMRRKTRHQMKKHYRRKGKISLQKFFQELREGDVVQLKAEPAVQTGHYFPRFHGNMATIVGKRGECYVMKMKDIKKEKTLIVHPVHLQKIK